MRRINILNIALATLAISFTSNLVQEGVASSSLLSHSARTATSVVGHGRLVSTPVTTASALVHSVSYTKKSPKFHGPLHQGHHFRTRGWPWGVTASDLRQWSRVSICEEGGNWHVRGSLYSGGLGITNYNWTYYSRGMGFPANAADATPVQQIAVAKKINRGYAVPDQHGCHAW